jgi:hypothetical protein
VIPNFNNDMVKKILRETGNSYEEVSIPIAYIIRSRDRVKIADGRHQYLFIPNFEGSWSLCSNTIQECFNLKDWLERVVNANPLGRSTNYNY